jgi:hypothetical protein
VDYTNADCTLEQRYFNTFKECANAQFVEQKNWLTGAVTRIPDAAHRICMATPKSEAAFQ